MKTLSVSVNGHGLSNHVCKDSSEVDRVMAEVLETSFTIFDKWDEVQQIRDTHGAHYDGAYVDPRFLSYDVDDAIACW